MWPYAIQTAAHIRNRCYNNRIKNTPYFMLTGRKPDLSRMGVFGSECYAYNHNHKKLDSRCTKGVFVGYDKNSPAYLVYHPHNGKVMKHRFIRFISKDNEEQQTQTDLLYEDSDLCRSPVNEAETDNPDCTVDTNTPTGKDQNERVDIPNSEANKDDPNGKDENKRSEVTHENDEQVASNPVQARRYPLRERNPPKFLAEFYTDLNDGNDLACNSTDYCYKVYGVPQTYAEAMNSPNATEWRKAMEEEMESLKENDTFELTTLPVGKNPVGEKMGLHHQGKCRRV